MIVFLVKHPSRMDEKDGFAQRVAWIDNLVSDKKRLYLDVSLKRNIKRNSIVLDSLVKIEEVNIFLHFNIIYSFIKKASVVYFHSIFSSVKFLPAYFFKKTITDVHGVVPEELLLSGQKKRAVFFGVIEKFVVAKGDALIYVTSAMREHFYKKYGRVKNDDRVISILPKIEFTKEHKKSVLKSERKENEVLYSGGLQPWQNIEMMLKLASANKDNSYVFLTGEAAELHKLAVAKNIKTCEVLSVPSHELGKYYLISTYGFILRDDIIVNTVACPTKMIDYLFWGLIPIVLSANIGDFNNFGFRYITIEDFDRGNFPNNEVLNEMREINYCILERIYSDSNNQISLLLDRFN